eukprot:m.139223 g.139223  ORF g.139223 m.139223 type:complete len:702 (+) comp11497_c0_seq12:67-2172(+)
MGTCEAVVFLVAAVVSTHPTSASTRTPGGTTWEHTNYNNNHNNHNKPDPTTMMQNFVDDTDTDCSLALFPPARASTMGRVQVWAALGSASTLACTGPMTSKSHPLPTTRCVVTVSVQNGTYNTSVVTDLLPSTVPQRAWQRMRVAVVDVSGWHGAVTISATVATVTAAVDTDTVHIMESGIPTQRTSHVNNTTLAHSTRMSTPGDKARPRHQHLGTTPLGSASWPFEIIDSGVRSTRLLDGAFVDIVHWSASEGAPFNEGLREMTSSDWRGQIQDMATAGIRTATIQAIFLNNMYPATAPTCDSYPGVALYPSKVYPRSGADPVAAGGGQIDAASATNFTDHADKLEAILSAADEFGVSVFVGLGNFAWFTYTDEALCWTKRVASEVWSSYGHHPSLYGWYASGEMSGDFSGGGNNRTDTVETMAKFFENFSHFASTELSPLSPSGRGGMPRAPSLLPIMQAINSYNVSAYATQPAGGWERVLEHVDVLAAFGFARLAGSSTTQQLETLCNAANASFWVDMELFSADMSRGLVPKDFNGVKSEILTYDAAPQIGCAYEYTGQMAGPSAAPAGLNSTAARLLYNQYLEYYLNVVHGLRPWPRPPPCVNATTNGTVAYVLVTGDPGLCAPAPGSHVSHVYYVGKACGNHSILWTAMRTPDFRPGLQPSDCTWSRAANPIDTNTYFGATCGVPPTKVELPTKVC